MKYNKTDNYTQDQKIRVWATPEETTQSRSNTSGVVDFNGSITPLFISESNALAVKLALDLTPGKADDQGKLFLDNRKQVNSSEAFDKVTDRKRSSVALSSRISSFDDRRANRMSGCCSVVSRIAVRNKTTGQVRYEFQPTITCKDRLCPHCARTRSTKLSNKLSEPLRDIQKLNGLQVSFLTLTFRNTQELRTFDELTRARKKLFKSKFWKEYGLVGSIGTLEVKLGQGSGLWHSHFHIVVFTEKELPTDNGKWTIETNQRLADEWYSITGDSFIIRGVSFDGNYQEILKYISKGTEEMTDGQLQDFCTWSKGRRFLFMTGQLYNNKQLKTLIKQAEEEEEDQVVIGEDEEIIETARLHFFPRLNNYVVMNVQTYEEARTATG